MTGVPCERGASPGAWEFVSASREPASPGSGQCQEREPERGRGTGAGSPPRPQGDAQPDISASCYHIRPPAIHGRLWTSPCVRGGPRPVVAPERKSETKSNPGRHAGNPPAASALRTEVHERLSPLRATGSAAHDEAAQRGLEHPGDHAHLGAWRGPKKKPRRSGALPDHAACFRTLRSGTAPRCRTGWRCRRTDPTGCSPAR